MLDDKIPSSKCPSTNTDLSSVVKVKNWQKNFNHYSKNVWYNNLSFKWLHHNHHLSLNWHHPDIKQTGPPMESAHWYLSSAGQDPMQQWWGYTTRAFLVQCMADPSFSKLSSSSLSSIFMFTLALPFLCIPLQQGPMSRPHNGGSVFWGPYQSGKCTAYKIICFVLLLKDSEQDS